MSKVLGSPEGLMVWNKLASSKNEQVKEYFTRLFQCAPLRRKVYFTDFEEQLKKKLNNQKMFSMTYLEKDGNWHIELFIEPK